ncbi:MAG: hypothetical protein HQK93_10735 [Nitrospirae bacterium]|nr:hypothetical protein [Nitrospirota bacterium]
MITEDLITDVMKQRIYTLLYRRLNDRGETRQTMFDIVDILIDKFHKSADLDRSLFCVVPTNHNGQCSCDYIRHLDLSKNEALTAIPFEIKEDQVYACNFWFDSNAKVDDIILKYDKKAKAFRKIKKVYRLL